MAKVSLTIQRDNGVTVSANGDIPDALVADIAMTLGAILFDASAEPVGESPAPAPE
jgi:hypothetical protein